MLAVLLTALFAYMRSGYFVGVDDDDQVVVYRGRQGVTFWFDPTVETETGLFLSDLDDMDRTFVLDGLEFSSLDDAETYVDDLEQDILGTDSP